MGRFRFQSESGATGSLLPVLMIAFVTSAAGAESGKELILRGNEQFKDGAFEKASDLYQQALEADPEVLEALFNRAVAEYQRGNLQDSQRLLRRVDSSAGAGDLAQAARYNLGRVALDRLQMEIPESPKAALEGLGEAARLFRGALDLDPADIDAARNLELTRYSMKQIQEQIDKMKEMQEKLDELAEDLGENQEQQEQEASESQELSEQQQQVQQEQQNQGEQSEQSKQQQQQQAQDQQDLSEKTQELSDRLDELRKEMPQQPQPSPDQDSEQQDPMEKASQALDEARQQQDRAQQSLEQGDAQEAQEQQENAAESLQEALEKIQQEAEQQQQQGEQGEAEQDDAENGEPEGEPEESEDQGEQSEEEQQQDSGDPQQGQDGEELDEKPTDEIVQYLLDKERREQEELDRRKRQQVYRTQPVDKDW